MSPLPNGDELADVGEYVKAAALTRAVAQSSRLVPVQHSWTLCSQGKYVFSAD
jgi:hypothetical protein